MRKNEDYGTVEFVITANNVGHKITQSGNVGKLSVLIPSRNESAWPNANPGHMPRAFVEVSADALISVCNKMIEAGWFLLDTKLYFIEGKVQFEIKPDASDDGGRSRNLIRDEEPPKP